MNLKGMHIFPEDESFGHSQSEIPLSRGDRLGSLNEYPNQFDPSNMREAYAKRRNELYQRRIQVSARVAPGFHRPDAKFPPPYALEEENKEPRKSKEKPENTSFEINDLEEFTLGNKENRVEDVKIVEKTAEIRLTDESVTSTVRELNAIKRYQEEDELKYNEPKIAKIYPKKRKEEQRPFNYLLKLEQMASTSLEDRKLLITYPIPKYAGTVKCNILRQKAGIIGSMYPKYELYIEGTRRLLLTAKKRSGNWTGNYLITLDHDDLQPAAPGYLGKLRADFWRNIFNVYDSGENPGWAKTSARFRENMGTVLYEGSWFSPKGPRKMTVIIPKVAEDDKRIPCIPFNEGEGLLELSKKDPLNRVLVLKNKKPRWSENLNAYVLDFGGRAKIPSVKNFILADEEEKENYMLLGKVEQHLFVLEVKWPLSLYQAFAIAISSIEK